VLSGRHPELRGGRQCLGEVLNLHGSPDCALDLHAVDDGRVIDLGAARTLQEPVVLQTLGRSAYIADPVCTIRITDGG
jgi:hypothetical protein